MASKRKRPIAGEDEDHQTLHISNKKHTLDSDEEDSDDYEKDDLKNSDIEGEEDGVEGVQDEVKITPFNMREELEEGHFDKEGNYHWNKDGEIKDNWLDNIDWVKVKDDKNYLNPEKSDDSDDSSMPIAFNEAHKYAEVLAFMKPSETVQKTLQRLGKDRTKISSAERLRRKKLGIVDEASEKITKFTELTNEILTRTGNMDIYQETYDDIKKKLNNFPGTSQSAKKTSEKESFDMYADDFEVKEKEKLEGSKDNKELPAEKNKLMWEYKWKMDDTKLNGPYTTEQMLKWVEEKYFKDGVYVRKVGEDTNFYSSNRIDFDLYL